MQQCNMVVTNIKLIFTIILKMIELSIIIPTFNEEKHLPKLIESIRKQSYKDYEIIIADNNSRDLTTRIVRKYKIRTVGGGSPAQGRNNGSKIAKGNLFLFMDADVVLPSNSLESLIQEFKKRQLDIASIYLKQSSKRIIDNLAYTIYNFWTKVIQFIDPHTIGSFILCNKDTFEKLEGFNESLTASSDYALGRAAKKHKLRIGMLTTTKILVSIRRFDYEGRFRFFSKAILIWLHRIFIGEVKSNLLAFKPIHHKKIRK